MVPEPWLLFSRSSLEGSGRLQLRTMDGASCASIARTDDPPAKTAAQIDKMIAVILPRVTADITTLPSQGVTRPVLRPSGGGCDILCLPTKQRIGSRTGLMNKPERYLTGQASPNARRNGVA